MIRGLIYLILFSHALISKGQDVRFYASTDARQIVAGNYFELSFTLEDAKGVSFQAPSFSDFQVLSGPNQSSQMSIVNGEVSQKVVYSYILTTAAAGNYRITPASVIVDGMTLKTESVSITVLKAERSTTEEAGSAEQDHFVRVELSRDTGYIGQQITLKYVLFTVGDVRSYNFINIPEFEGFFAQEIQNYTERPVRVVVNGRQYVSRTIKVIALYPQQKGNFMLDPATVNIGISSGQSRSNFFFNTNLKPVRLVTSTAKVRVIDLPAGSPSSFSGAVGQFEFTATIDKKTIQKDDAITLTFQIRGDGDNKFLQAPSQPFKDDFEIYDPNLLREQTTLSGPRIVVTKTYEYLMVPRKIGDIPFSPELSYFNPDSNDYVTLRGGVFNVSILGTNQHEVAEFEEKSVDLPPIFSTTTLKQKGKFFYASTPYWMANGALALGFIGLLVIKRVQTYRSNIDPSVKRISKARRVAIQKLALTKKDLDQNDITSFYVDLRNTILEYLADKTGSNGAQLSKADVQKILEDYDLHDIVDDIMILLVKGEQALYAPIIPSNDHDSYNISLDLIEKMETGFKN